MSYTKNTWAKGDLITASKLNNIESGIASIATGVDGLQTSMQTLSTQSQETSAAVSRNTEALTSLATKLDQMQQVVIQNNSTMGGLNAAVSSTDAKIGAFQGVITELRSGINAIAEQVKNLKLSGAEIVTVTAADLATKIDQPTANLVVSIPSETPLAGVKAIVAKTLSMPEATVESGRLNLTASDSCYIENLTSSGELKKAVSNAAVSINGTSDLVKITNSELGQTGYNAIEIGLSSGTPKNVLIDNIHFAGKLDNNAILIFNTADNAVVTISNCVFDDCSNPIRISNKGNVKLTVNVVNCEFKKWEVTPAYAGCILFQDYTSKTAEEVEANNLFSSEKITVNFMGCTGPNGPMVYGEDDLPSVIGSSDPDKQIAYVYDGVSKKVTPYVGNESRFPTFTFA